MIIISKNAAIIQRNKFKNQKTKAESQILGKRKGKLYNYDNDALSDFIA